MNQPPVAIGLLLCEQVIIEEGTKNVTPVNCFSRRISSVFPTDPTDFMAVAFLTDCVGEMSLEVTIESLHNWDDVSRLGQKMKFENRLSVYRYVVRMRHVTFPSAGLYQATLFADGEPFAHRKFSSWEKHP